MGILAAQNFLPPDFICTRSEAGDEVLTWRNTDRLCGPYVGTVIFRAGNINGPYAPIDTVFDRGATEYRDPNPTGGQLFYYLRYLAECSTEFGPISDTLDSFIPVTPELRYVSVENGDLRLSWSPSPSPEVSGYVIFEVTPIGINAIDTVGEVTDYLVSGVPEAELTDRQYRIAAIDACGNDSPQGRIAAATGLVAEGGQNCDRDIRLRTNITDSDFIVSEPVLDTALYVATDGGAFREAEFTLAADGGDIVYSGGRDGQTVCAYLLFRLEAGDSVLTDTTCRTLDITPGLPPLELYGTEYDDAGGLVVKYSPVDEIGPLIDEAFLQYGGVNLPTQRIPLTATSFTADSLVAPEPIPPNPGGVVILDLFDECGRQLLTNLASGTFLSARSLGGRVGLNWTPGGNDDTAAVSTFTLLRQEEGGDFLEIESGLTDLNYVDREVGSGCYRVILNFVPAGRDTIVTFRSNVACVVEEAQVYLPNVFSPTADRPENRIFQPQLSTLIGVEDYRLDIFDRWGGLVFSTDDPLEPWAGQYGGTAAPAGPYVFNLLFSQDGNLQRFTGVVQLLY
jgi:gliding motility-associated-like protein